MQNPILLVLFVLGILMLTAFYFVSALLYKSRHQQKYHFYQMFPYEFNYPSVFRNNPYGNILFVLGGFAVVTFYIFNPYSSIYRIIAIIIAIVFVMILICLIMMPLYYLKTHMALSIASMTLSMALPLFNFFLAFSQYKIEADSIKRVMCIISMVVSGILALMMIALILNPRLTFKIYLDKDKDTSGNEVLKRPRIIFLALSEWVSIFIFFLSPLGVLLISIL